MKMRPLTRAAISLACVVSALFLAASATTVTADGPGTTTRVSVASDGTQGNDKSCSESISAISADGRYVAFESRANNLVPGDTNGPNGQDIFVRDLLTGQTTRVSVASDGSQGNSASYGFSISADGRYVAFKSYANNLVPGDSNWFPDIFVHDRQTGQTTRVSVASDGSQSNGKTWYFEPSISADGRYVAFDSSASNLVPGDTNGTDDDFVHDRQTGQTTRVSVASNGAQGNLRNYRPSISGDGRYVAFHSSASNLVPGDTNGTEDVFVHDRQTGQTTRVTVASDGSQSNGGNVYYGPSISGDGRYVAFDSTASDLVPGDINGGIFVHDRQTGQTTRVSVASDGSLLNWVRPPSVSADGRSVAFESSQGVFVHDRQTGETTWVAGGGYPSMSAHGRYVAFCSEASNLVPGDTNGQMDVFVRDRGESALAYSISGRVTDGDGAPVSGVTISAGSAGSATADASGFYTLTAVLTGTFTLTPGKSGYTFSPTSRAVSVPPSAAGINFFGFQLPVPTGTPSPTPSLFTIINKGAWPSPFNPGTGPVELRFSASRYSFVYVGVRKYDIFNGLPGEDVAQFPGSWVKAGDKVVSWDGKDSNGATVPNGIYQYEVFGLDEELNYASTSGYLAVTDEGNTLDLSKLEPGDILLTYGGGWVQPLLYGGYWDHAAMYVGRDEQDNQWLIESIARNAWPRDDYPGVTRNPVQRFHLAKAATILRVRSASLQQEKAAVDYMAQQIGKRYNFSWFGDKTGTDTFYCSQLVWRAFYEQGIDLDSDKGTPWLARPIAARVVPPDDIYFSPNVEIVDIDVGTYVEPRQGAFWVASPVNMLVTDPAGRRVGVLPSNGEVINEIESATFSGKGTEPEWVSLRVLSNGTYKVTVVGTATGSYSLTGLDQLNNTTLLSVSGNTGLGATNTYTTTVISKVLLPSIMKAHTAGW